MAILKCKMCGGDLNVAEGMSVCECEYCGTKQTVPTVDDEKKITLFARANRLRFNNEFDKAAGVYEAIVADFPEEAEAYWGLVLCKYGIEYVDDPKTGKKIPTCHRSSFDSVLDDNNFDLTLEYADPTAHDVYREEAKQIEELRRGIIAVSSKEEPYDIFICYKETDDKGERTIDSVIAQDVYAALTEKGYRVFFSRISLEDKLGVEYEPYIFAALHSAKVMLAFGTHYNHYNAVWVRNEWSRYLQLIAKGEKKTLIPCYKGIDAYDMPREFAKLQAQDMGKVGALQDLLRGIEKVLGGVKSPAQEPTGTNNNVTPLLERAFLSLEDGEWDKADALCEQVLNINPKHAEAYVCKLLVNLRLRNRESLKNCALPFEMYGNYQKAMRFGDDALKAELESYNSSIVKRNLKDKYDSAVAAMNTARDWKGYQLAATQLEQLGNYADAAQLAQQCHEKGILTHNETIYREAKLNAKKGTVDSLEKAIKLFSSIPLWKDSGECLKECQNQLQQSKAENWATDELKKQRTKRITIIITLAVVLILLLTIVVIPRTRYNNGHYATYIRRRDLTHFDIPDDATEIKANAFKGCTSLETVSIPYGVTTIGNHAFYHCGLERINIPTSVTTIGNYAFANCDSLTKVEIPVSVTYIKEYAFSLCDSLTTVYISNSVIDIERNAFYRCDDLDRVYFAGTIDQWRAFGVSFGYSGVTVHCSDGDYEPYY